jgi:hypothetical protein
MLRSERGVALAVVLVLSAVVLLIMTTLIYMVTTGTQVSGLQKRYKTALEAGEGGADIFYQLISLRGESSGQTTFANQLTAAGITFSATTPGTCTGLSSGVTTTYTGLAAKLMTASTSWTNCDSALAINPAVSSSYDMKVTVGTTQRYDVYAKIVSTIPGNTGGDEGLLNKGVVSANTGEVAVMPIPSLYAIEAVATNPSRDDERAKLSILYQY